MHSSRHKQAMFPLPCSRVSAIPEFDVSRVCQEFTLQALGMHTRTHRLECDLDSESVRVRMLFSLPGERTLDTHKSRQLSSGVAG